MNSLIAQFKATQTDIQEYFLSCDELWHKGKFFNIRLIHLSLVCIALGFLLFSINGKYTAFHSIQNLSLALLPNAAWQNITFAGDTIVALAIALLFSYRYPRLVIAIFAAAIVGTLLIHGLKHVMGSTRPPGELAEDMLTVIGPVYKRASFPSGHTATAFILAGLLTHCIQSVSKKCWVLAAAVLVGISRIACGVHWPVDVCAGAALGLFSAWAGIQISYRVRLNIHVYLPISILLLTAAIMLFDYDGGFTHTSITARLLAITALIYWSACWLVQLVFRPKYVLQSQLAD